MSARAGKRAPRRVPRRVVSLRRALSKLGLASRTEADAWILAGRVRVGAEVVRDPSRRVDPDVDRIRVGAQPARPAPLLYWMLNKPVGSVTTRRDPQGRPTVYDLLPADLPFVSPVGRLDLQSCGLLLLTNDTQLAAHLTHPGGHVPKVYEARLDAGITSAEAQRLAAGVEIDGRRTLPARFELLGPEPCAALRVTLVEGRNRQVRRMFATLGRTVTHLRRVALGPLRLGRLRDGEARPLRAVEIRALESSVGERQLRSRARL